MNTFSKLSEEDIKDAIGKGISYRDVLRLLNCYLNSGNIKLLKKFINDNDIAFSDLKHNGILKIKTDRKCECQFCHNEYNAFGIRYHERFCKENPNREVCCGNKGKTKGYPIWNKGLTAKDNESIRQQSITLHNKFECGEVRPPLEGKHLSEETKQKQRESTIEYLKKYKGWHHPRYNIRSGEYIKSLNEEKGWNLQYYDNGGEVQVAGYFLDGYDKERNIVFEYDEPTHYKDVYNNVLKDKDLIRQDNIIAELGCQFWRYNERLNLLY